jgi:type 1 glutamine amidotransferase
VVTSKPFATTLAALLVAFVGFQEAASGQARHILLIADRPSHGPRQHEHNATVWQLQKWLSSVKGVSVATSYDGWPDDLSVLDKADAIFMFCTGGNSHDAFQGNRTDALQKAAARGAGLMFFHYCVEPPADKGRPEMLAWIGGYFEIHYSVNPTWEADVRSLPDHPITRGVKPFRMRDEWYYNMRFAGNMRGVTPIVTAVPGPETLSRPDGPHSGNPDVRAKAGQPHTLVWAFERPGGGRGVGWTGGHYHDNLANGSFRKLLLNSLLWLAKLDVPANGVEVTVTNKELDERLDPKPARGRGNR